MFRASRFVGRCRRWRDELRVRKKLSHRGIRLQTVTGEGHVTQLEHKGQLFRVLFARLLARRCRRRRRLIADAFRFHCRLPFVVARHRIFGVRVFDFTILCDIRLVTSRRDQLPCILVNARPGTKRRIKTIISRDVANILVFIRVGSSVAILSLLLANFPHDTPLRNSCHCYCFHEITMMQIYEQNYRVLWRQKE